MKISMTPIAHPQSLGQAMENLLSDNESLTKLKSTMNISHLFSFMMELITEAFALVQQLGAYAYWLTCSPADVKDVR